MKTVVPADRTRDITYAVRDIILVAKEAKKAGKKILPLNIGDPINYDFKTPLHIIEAIHKAMLDGYTGYADSTGVEEAVDAIRAEAERKGIRNIQYIFTSTGGSEAIELALSGLVNRGENVLIPSPGYPLYSAVLTKLETEPNMYYLDEDSSWQPDVNDIRSRINSRTRGIVLINPNNPTGALYSKEVLEEVIDIAREHNLVVFADEIYDKLIFDGKEHVSVASLVDDVPVVTFNGLAKSYLSPGLRIGWAIISGKSEYVREYSNAVQKFTRARLCASHPAQFAIKAALEGPQDHIREAMAKLHSRRELSVRMLNEINGIHCVKPEGAFYAFPSIDIKGSDKTFVESLIRETGVVVVHGSGFGQKPGTNHFRIVLLPDENILKSAFAMIGEHIGKFIK